LYASEGGDAQGQVEEFQVVLCHQIAQPRTAAVHTNIVIALSQSCARIEVTHMTDHFSSLLKQ
jgi:hypothetical protein